MTYFPRLFSTDNAKAAKASGFGYINSIHYMAPYNLGGFGNVCSHATEACIRNCLGWQSGHAAMVTDLEHGTNSVRESRKLKAQLFMTNRVTYLNALVCDIARIVAKARRDGLEPCIRLNGSSDIPFERINFTLTDKTVAAIAKLYGSPPPLFSTILALFPDVQFVDYTKNPNRLGKGPANLDLTFSYGVTNSTDCVKALLAGHNVAMIFDGGLPDRFAGFPVINGDIHDLRHLDAKGGNIVGLTPKGKRAKNDATGFVVRQGEAFQTLQETWEALTQLYGPQAAVAIRNGRQPFVQAAIDSGKLLVIAA
jgi:hypothetical protein